MWGGVYAAAIKIPAQTRTITKTPIPTLLKENNVTYDTIQFYVPIITNKKIKSRNPELPQKFFINTLSISVSLSDDKKTCVITAKVPIGKMAQYKLDLLSETHATLVTDTANAAIKYKGSDCSLAVARKEVTPGPNSVTVEVPK